MFYLKLPLAELFMAKKNRAEIVAATRTDLEIIQALAYEIWPAYYSNIISLDQIEYMLRNLYNLDYLEQQEINGSRFFLVKVGSKPVGFLGLTPREKSVHLDKLYLIPDCRGKGYGRMMIDFSSEFSFSLGQNKLTLNVNRFNDSLLFYLSLGFVIQSEVDIPYGPFLLTDYILERSIPV